MRLQKTLHHSWGGRAAHLELAGRSLSVHVSGGQAVLAMEVPSSLCVDMVQACISRGTGVHTVAPASQDGGILLHLVHQWTSESNIAPGRFPSLQLTASEAGEPGGSRAAGPGEEKVVHVTGTCPWEGGGHLLLAGSRHLPRRGETGR